MCEQGSEIHSNKPGKNNVISFKIKVQKKEQCKYFKCGIFHLADIPYSLSHYSQRIFMCEKSLFGNLSGHMKYVIGCPCWKRRIS